MGGRYLKFLSAVSLALALTLLAFLIRSATTCDEVYWSRSGHEYALGSQDGALYFQSVNWACNSQSQSPRIYSASIHDSHGGPDIRAYYATEDDGPKTIHHFWQHVGIALLQAENGHGDMLHEFFIADYWLLALLSLLPALTFFHWIKRRRHPANTLCRQCGYDLRATPTRCPECGTSAGSTAVPNPFPPASPAPPAPGNAATSQGPAHSLVNQLAFD